MKRTIVGLGLLAGVSLVGIVGCERSIEVNRPENGDDGSADKPPVPTNPPYAKADVDENLFDFGFMESDQKGSHTFTIKNASTEKELVLGKPTTDCNCTVSGLTSNKLAPGKTAKVKLEWRTPSMPQQFIKSAVIWTSDPENRKIVLTIRGIVQKRLVVSPPRYWMIGAIEGTEPHPITGFVLTNHVDSFKILKITPSSKSTMTASWTPLKSDELRTTYKSKAGYEIKVTVTARDTIGPFRESIDIKTDIDGGTSASVEIIGTVRGPVILQAPPEVIWKPDTMIINFGRFRAADGKSASLFLFVADSKEGPFKLTKVIPDDRSKFLSVKLKPLLFEGDEPSQGTRKRYLLTFTIRPGAPAASRVQKERVRVTLETNHPRARSMKFGIEFHSD